MKTYSIADGDKVEKYHIALLFNKSKTAGTYDWAQLAKATENSISLNPETEDLDFIVDKNPTTVVKKYKPSLSNPLTLYKGNEDYEFFWPLFYNLPTGAEANGKMLIVFMNEENTSKYDAWLCDVTYVMDSLDPTNSQLSFTTNINGTIEKGTVTVSDGKPTFTAG